MNKYQSVTSPNPPFPRTLYCLNPCLVMGCLEEKDDAQLQTQHLWAAPWPTVNVEAKMLTDLSTIFHCRNRSKYMLFWYWLKGSPLRYLWSALVQEKGCHWLFTHTQTHVERTGWRTPCRPERHLSRDQHPDCGCNSAHGSAGWTHTDWTERAQIKAGTSRPSPQWPQSSRSFCPTRQKMLSPRKVGSQVRASSTWSDRKPSRIAAFKNWVWTTLD